MALDSCVRRRTVVDAATASALVTIHASALANAMASLTSIQSISLQSTIRAKPRVAVTRNGDH
jgi:predicted nicotinamide N-methyase